MAHWQPPRAATLVPERPRTRVGLSLLVAVLACGGAGTDDTARAPTRAGDVWEVDSANDRDAAQGALLAFVSGTHVLLVDGDDTYAGMRRTHGGKAPDGGQPLALGGGIEATLAPSGDGMQLRFASGETLALHKRATAGSVR